ncbi:HD domain-containing protein [Arachidicoccus rhizosphaerae]|uniref:HD domain-containing protein n=1 Tax=Arachidicoccus rhizosphaerae TaxID=551991 RepID=UPI000B83BED1|nr:HD domain-containing protein [Arachidicoccus rhizosphaerae]
MLFDQIIQCSPLVASAAEYAKQTLEQAEGGHDWQHIQRVVVNSERIAQSEACDQEIVFLGALLHDIADSKFHGGDDEIGPLTARRFLISQNAPETLIEHVEQIVRHISYKGGQKSSFYSPELAIVRDADRLDAIGAIGIARAFNYGGFKNRKIFDPSIAPVAYATKEAYKASTAPTINHFYEKLLKLKDLMHTDTGKALAQQRHQYMLDFLTQFFEEVQFDGFA